MQYKSHIFCLILLGISYSLILSIKNRGIFFFGTSRIAGKSFANMSPNYCTYKDLKFSRYMAVMSFSKLQILMFSLQAQMTKYKGDEKCFSNQESESTMMSYSQVSNFALSKTCIQASYYACNCCKDDFLASFDVRLAHPGTSVVFSYLLFHHFNFVCASLRVR